MQEMQLESVSSLTRISTTTPAFLITQIESFASDTFEANRRYKRVIQEDFVGEMVRHGSGCICDSNVARSRPETGRDIEKSEELSLN